MPRVIHFEIHAEQPERAAKFYTDLFGWQITKWGGPQDYWVIKTGEGTPGIDGGIFKRMGPGPSGVLPVIAYVCTIDTPNVDEYAAQATKLGGKVCVPKMAIPGVGWLTYCNDTEGNIFGMMQNDPNAK